MCLTGLSKGKNKEDWDGFLRRCGRVGKRSGEKKMEEGGWREEDIGGRATLVGGRQWGGKRTASLI